MRLIDADVLMDAFRKHMVERYDREKCVSEENCKACERGCLWRMKVMEAPTIEAEPVKHGRWENWSPPYLGMEYSYDTKKCSECGHTMANALLIPAHYCPNCGARMDGEPNG